MLHLEAKHTSSDTCFTIHSQCVCVFWICSGSVFLEAVFFYISEICEGSTLKSRGWFSFLDINCFSRLTRLSLSTTGVSILWQVMSECQKLSSTLLWKSYTTPKKLKTFSKGRNQQCGYCDMFTMTSRAGLMKETASNADITAFSL